ncbi:MAG TPA: cache domain-containing protein [Clostridia bacterium]|nr:cache domain-containing protein [Clostridia bacterium]
MSTHIKSRSISFKVKLILAFMLTVIPIILLGAISAAKSAAAIKTSTADATIQTMEQTTKYLDLLLQNVDVASAQIAGNDIFTGWAGGISGVQRKELELALENVRKNCDFISGILFVPEVGYAVSTGTYPVRNMGLTTIKNTGFYRKAERVGGGIVWLGSHPELDRHGVGNKKEYALFAVRMIKNKSGETAGLLLIDVKHSYITNLLNNIKLGTGGQVHLVSPDGRDICEPDGAAAQKSGFTNLPFFRKIKNGTALSGSEYVSYSGTDYLLTFSRLGTTGYVVSGLLPTSALYSASRSIAGATAGMVLVAILLAAALGLAFAISAGNVLKRVAMTAHKAAKGDAFPELLFFGGCYIILIKLSFYRL